MAPSAEPEALTRLTQLSNKPGVLATLILSRVDGAIIRASGFPLTSSTYPSTGTTTEESDDYESHERQRPRKGDLKSAPEVAGAVWRFFANAKELAKGILEGGVDEQGAEAMRKGGDEDGTGVDLLRMRLGRREVVVVPDVKFLLVVVREVGGAGG